MASIKKQIIRRQAPEAHKLPDHLHPVLTRIYSARKLTSPEDLDNSFEQLLPPHLLKNMDLAVGILVAAIEQNSRIMIVADYDADGATSCALVLQILQQMGASNVSYVVPDRFTYGYGLTPEIVSLVLPQKPDLIITVDNGIASIEGVNAARDHNIAVIVTDHHLPGAELPNADAIVNPNQPGDIFPSKNLAGVGVAFYVMLALRARLREMDWFSKHKLSDPKLAQFLDIVALGTVADLVPLDHNNRILVSQGLERINRGQCCDGIKALCRVSGKELDSIFASELGFFLAPRLNAAGRLQDMGLGIECLLSRDLNHALSIATKLDKLNLERRTIQDDMQQQAVETVDRLNLKVDSLPKAICLFQENWHQGVIGLVASRIKDKVHRPVIAFAPGGDETLKGSARSITGLHIRDVLDSVASKYPNILQKFGGHAMAAGLTIKAENFDAFDRAFCQEVDNLLADDDLEQSIVSDGELNDAELEMSFAEILRTAGPWGQAFPEPLFDGKFDVIEQRVVGEKHLKMVLRLPKAEKTIDAIAFNLVPEGRAPSWSTVRAAYKLDINEFRGRRSLQLIVNYLESATV